MPGIGISPCPPFAKLPSIPGVIYDGNTVAWYKHTDMPHITMDGAFRVSSWRDILNSGRDLLQAVGANQPLWSLANGILFDGANDYMAALAFVFNRPEFIYFVGRQVTWTANERFFDGLGVASLGSLYQGGVSPNVAMSAGVASPQDGNLALNTFGIVRCLFNGAASSLQVNLNAAWNGNTGVNNMGGFVLGVNGALGQFGNIQVKEIILRRTADNAAVQTSIYNYLRISNAIP